MHRNLQDLLNEVTFPRLIDIEVLKGDSQNEEAKKHVPNERTDKNSKKRMKQNKDK